MRLVHEDLELPLLFQENKVNVLVVEHKAYFSRMIMDLKEQMEGGLGPFVLSKNNKILHLAKTAELIIDVFALDINSRKAISKLYEVLEQEAVKEENYLDSLALRTKIMAFVEQILQDQELPVVFDQDFGWNSIFKAMNIRFEEECESLVEGIVNYLEICSGALGIKLFVFVNLKSFLSREDLLALYKQLAYKKIFVLLLENSVGEKLPEEEILLLDEDLCEIIIGRDV